jgi:hypothetical protein
MHNKTQTDNLMKSLYTIMIAAAIATGASAQTNVLKSRPANPSEGKMLTME